MSSQSKDQKSTQTNEPPKFLQPYLQDAARRAASLYYSKPPKYYKGPQSVGFSPQTEEAMSMQVDRAMNGSPVSQAANQNMADTLRGNYLYGGEGFNAAIDAATRKINPIADSRFSLGGRLNSGLADVSKTQAIADAFASQYGQERNNQMQAAQMSPMLAQQDYFDMQKLGEVGARVEGQAQQRLDEKIDKYNYYQNLPEQRLSQYVGLLQGSYPGSTQTSMNPMTKNRGAGAVGGAASGAAMFAQSGNPWLMGAGAIGGGLLGYYS